MNLIDFKRLRDNCEMLRYKQIDAPRKENITIRIVSANSVCKLSKFKGKI